MSGYYVCATNPKSDLTFTIEADGQKYEIDTCLHTNATYGSPYSIRKEFIMGQNGILKVTVQSKHSNPFTFHNNIVSLSPMIKVN
jgi:hypothetical protein